MKSVTYKDKYIVYEDGNIYSLSQNKMMKPKIQEECLNVLELTI